MIQTDRRSFLRGLGALIATPAVVRVTSLMSVRGLVVPRPCGNSLLTIEMIMREAVEAIMLFRNSNAFIEQIDCQYDDEFAVEGARIGSTLRIRLPNDYRVVQ